MDVGYYIVGAAFLMCGVIGYWLGKTPIIDMPKERTVKGAVAVLVGYCEKHTECKNCYFCYAPNKCFLEDCNPPCDWSTGRLLEWKGDGR